jgi:hypothetical protein
LHRIAFVKFIPVSAGTTIMRRWARIGAVRRALLVEATGELAVAAAAVGLLPFKRAVRSGSINLLSTAVQPHTALTEDIRWAVQAAAKRVPWRAVCFQQGLAIQRMLRRRGVDARLHYGVGHVDQGLGAHVWVSVGGSIVIGGEQAGAFRLLASYP